MVIDIKKSANKGGVASIYEGKLFLVGLEGSEQVALIGSDGMLRQETKHINESLLGLIRSIWCCSDPKCAIKLSVIGEIDWSSLVQRQNFVHVAKQATWPGLAKESFGREAVWKG